MSTVRCERAEFEKPEGFEQSVKRAISISSSSSRKEGAPLTRTWTSSSSSKISSGGESISSTAMP